MRNVELIKLEELQEIRRIWVIDKHELEDRLPGIYEAVTNEPYPGAPLDDNLSLGAEEMALLEALCGDDRLHYELTRELLSVTRQQRNSARRAGLNRRIEQAFSRHYFDDADDAIARARAGSDARRALNERRTGAPRITERAGLDDLSSAAPGTDLEPGAQSQPGGTR